MTRTAAARKTAVAAIAAAFPIPTLAKNEVYAGVLVEDGKPKHHLVLLPGDESKKWKDAVAWAKKQGGTLPTRKEQALLFANAAGKFERAWYWSSEEYTGLADCAWFAHFSHGHQYGTLKSFVSRCRAVRRVAI